MYTSMLYSLKQKKNEFSSKISFENEQKTGHRNNVMADNIGHLMYK